MSARATQLTNLRVTGDITLDGSITIGGASVANGVAQGDLAWANGKQFAPDGTTATASSNAATIDKQSGVVTSEALTTAGLAGFTLTLTNALIAATSIVLASVANGTNSQGTPVMGLITPGAGSATIIVRNVHATQALNGTLVISFLVLNPA